MSVSELQRRFDVPFVYTARLDMFHWLLNRDAPCIYKFYCDFCELMADFRRADECYWARARSELRCQFVVPLVFVPVALS